MKNTRWDIFTTSSEAPSLWFGFQLARSLVDRGQATRLFTDELNELSQAVADIHPLHWQQHHQGIEVVDRRMAEVSPVSSVTIQMLGAPLPDAYRARLASHPTPTQCVNVLAHDDMVRPIGPIAVIGQDGACTRVVAQFGDPPYRAGYVKQGRGTPLLRRTWKKSALRTGMLQALGLRADLLDGKLSVFFDVRHPASILPLVECLACGPREVCLFMDPRPMQTLAEQAGLVWVRDKDERGSVLRHGGLTLVELPSRRWFLTDELIWACDLVMTTQSDIAMRSCESGTPVVWSCNDNGFFNWYVTTSREVIRRTVADIFEALATGRQVKSAWLSYMARWEEVRSLAELVSQRVRRAPDLAAILMAGLAGASPETMARQFAPTVPGMEFA